LSIIAGDAMLAGIGSLNLKVVVVDSDYYALQSINSYLAWDRRTRVTFLTEEINELWEYLRSIPHAEHPDFIVLDADHLGGAAGLVKTLERIRSLAPDALVICIAQHIDVELVEASADAGARAYLLKHDVRLQIAAALVFALEHDFIITVSVARASKDVFNTRLFHARVLPDPRDYPEMTERIKQAIKLCVIEGMPAHLAADEMGISLHTIRGYIKEGYRILEAYDRSEYPTDMTPQERAFMRFTALSDNVEEEEA
jgi:DNA-binding NarL/FixJ family response regulator